MALLTKEHVIKVNQDFDLMQKAFNKNNPLINFNESGLRTDQDIQQGYQFLFSGAMLGIRNPKAHEVEEISKSDAMEYPTQIDPLRLI